MKVPGIARVVKGEKRPFFVDVEVLVGVLSDVTQFLFHNGLPANIKQSIGVFQNPDK